MFNRMEAECWTEKVIGKSRKFEAKVILIIGIMSQRIKKPNRIWKLSQQQKKWAQGDHCSMRFYYSRKALDHTLTTKRLMHLTLNVLTHNNPKNLYLNHYYWYLHFKHKCDCSHTECDIFFITCPYHLLMSVFIISTFTFSLKPTSIFSSDSSMSLYPFHLFCFFVQKQHKSKRDDASKTFHPIKCSKKK